MTTELHLAQLELEVPRLLASARDAGLLRKKTDGRRWDDLGYAVHQQLKGLFQDMAPQPFRTVGKKGRGLTVLGYTSADAKHLRQVAEEFGQPATLEACRLDRLATKPMPESLFEPGRRLGFEVRICPVVRLGKDVKVSSWPGGDGTSGPRTFREGAEIDAFLQHRYLRDEDGDRETVYRSWFADRLAGRVELLNARLEGFRRVRVLRRGDRDENGHRSARVAERPDALLSGTFGITDGEAFRTLLSRGVGRHKAFGFGMLLLRPAASH